MSFVTNSFRGRVIAEANELEEKLTKLFTFINTSEIFKALHQTDKHLLTEQHTAMTRYLSILRQRISRFPRESQT